MSINKNFKKSSFSFFEREMSARCVEVCIGKNKVSVRHSKKPSPELEFTLEEWDAFIKGAKNDEFDLIAEI